MGSTLQGADLMEGTIVANLEYDKLNQPNPVFHGGTVLFFKRGAR